MIYIVEESESDSEERSEVCLSGTRLGGTRLQEGAYTEKGKSVVACIEGAPCITEEGESSGTKKEFDLDPRMPVAVEKTGLAEDTISIPVDQKDPSNVLKNWVTAEPHLETATDGILAS